jgi:acyl-CoA dehydrogenase
VNTASSASSTATMNTPSPNIPSPSGPSYLDWPFFDQNHRALKAGLDAWCVQSFSAPGAKGTFNAAHPEDRASVDAHCQALVQKLGSGGWLAHAVAGTEHGGHREVLDSRSLCLLRETLGFHEGLADFAFAMQGLGSGAISLFGTDEQKKAYLPSVAQGSKIAAFALSEPDAGSDVAGMQCLATPMGDHVLLNGEKTWISNGGIADFYVLFARDGMPGGPKERGTKTISAYIVDAHTSGLEVAERIDVVAPHPLALLRFNNCRVPLSRRIGEAGQGFKVAMSTLDVFRTSVAAASLGFARRAMHEAIAYSKHRAMFNGYLSDFQLTQAKLAQMATQVDAAALLTYRAAWMRDTGKNTTKEAAMAKMTATESAQWIIDQAVQIFGGLGVQRGTLVESLYREIRALRIYEGATEVQQLIIARELLK